MTLATHALDDLDLLAIPFGDERLPDRFWSKVKDAGNCWLWVASFSSTGYGNIGWDGRTAYSHRISWAMLVGPIPEGLVVDHICRNRSCVRPSHMQVVTNKQNCEHQAATRSHGASRYRGVGWHKASSKWIVAVTNNYVSHHGGLYECEHEAGRAAAELRATLFTNSLTDRMRSETPGDGTAPAFIDAVPSLLTPSPGAISGAS